MTGYAPHRLAAIGMGRALRPTRLLRHLNAFENGGRTARTYSGVLDHFQESARQQQHQIVRDGDEGERARHP
jgi:hypothetical protein